MRFLDCTVFPSAQLTLCLKNVYQPKHWTYEFSMHLCWKEDIPFFKENTKVEVVCLQSPRKYRIITVNKGRCSNHHTYWISGYLSLSFSISWWQMTTHHSTHFQSSLKRYSSWDSDFSDKKILANQYVFNPLNYYNQFFHECTGYSTKNIFQYPLQLHKAVKHIYCFNTIQTINTAVITYLMGRSTTKREGKCETNFF